MQNKTILKSIEKLSNHVNQRRQIQSIFLCIYTIFAGLFEIISIASILPFVRLVTDIEYNVAKDLYFMSDFFAQKTRKETVIIYYNGYGIVNRDETSGVGDRDRRGKRTLLLLFIHI